MVRSRTYFKAEPMRLTEELQGIMESLSDKMEPFIVTGKRIRLKGTFLSGSVARIGDTDQVL